MPKQKKKTKSRTVIVLHGWLDNRTDMLTHSSFLINGGYNVLLYDQRSHGNSDTGLISFGRDDGRDLIDAVDFLVEEKGIDKESIGALGVSLGASSILHALNQEKRLFKAVVLEGLFADSYHVGDHFLKDKFGKVIGSFIGVFLFTLGTQLWSRGKFRHSKPFSIIKNLQTPIFIIRGGKDRVVPDYSYQMIKQNAKNSQMMIWENGEGGHTSSINKHSKEYIEKVLSFFDKNL